MNNYVLLPLLCGLLLLRCGFLPLAGGSTDTELGSVVIGKLYDEQGRPALHTRVDLIPQRYIPVTDAPLPDRFIDSTDSMGGYVFKNVPAGAYTILAAHRLSNRKLLITGLVVGSGDTEAVIRPDTLRQTGSIAIELSDPIDSVNGYVYIQGTSFFVHVARYAVLDGIPSGRIPSVSYADRTDTTKNYLIGADVNVVAGDTAIITDYHSWSDSLTILLNTSATGADVSNNVTRFPVLVRLTSANFNFAQAKGRGEDLRFAKPNGVSLPYEIEQWEAAKGQAAVWVNVDTLYGNSTTQYIVMRWGNPNAADSSNGAAVFDTAAGFTDVLHLGENDDSVYDATGDAFNGMNSGSTMTTGIVGNSRKFANGNYIKISGLLKSPSNVTLSAWVRYDTASKGQDVFSIGDAVLIRLDDSINGMGTIGSYHNDSMVNDSNYANVCSRRFLAKTGWHYIAYSINSATQTQTFYIDGAQCAISHDVNPIYYTGLGTDTYIGKHGNGKTIFNFIGQVDEVRVNHISVSADWIKLCFMNQKAQDVLVRW